MSTKTENLTAIEVHHNLDNFISDSWEPLAEFIEALNGVINSIPEEFKASARIRAVSPWEGHFDFYVIYRRPETPAEREHRESLETHRAKLRRAHDLAHLAALRAMYGDAPDGGGA